MKFFACLALAIALLPVPGLARENGRTIAGISLAAKQQNALPPVPWISTLRISGRDSTAIDLADGRQLMRRPTWATSYNQGRYEVSRFYKPDSMRVNVVLNYAGRTAGEIISLGVDSGYRAEKISVKPALFLGYARSLQVGQGKYFTFAAGGWFGGEVSHTACRDEVGRTYYCGTVTAWSDFRPQRHQLQRYYQLVYRYEF